ncbi:hypothetical protein CLCR_04365 [Cladophialophora carrionii]|uniref:Uncharacterized protein n=1 Tax=Cladophialophora carrionii TaxID=86049 RepID=A0A1C1CJ88_9EURO|nr:hypothetical protein CLCR_04365 [Cladophialophora carrionii]
MSSPRHTGKAVALDGHVNGNGSGSGNLNGNVIAASPTTPPHDAGSGSGSGSSSSSSSRSRHQPASPQARTRMYRLMTMRLEQDRTSWGRCCKCENGGKIMSWPRCKVCRHHCCQKCDYRLDRTSVDTDAPIERGSTAWDRFEKMNELSGEMCLELEALEFVETLTPPQREGVARGWEIIRSFNQWLEDMEDGESDEERPTEAA